jgi:hypothetical protein
MLNATTHWWRFERHWVDWACLFALARAGNSIAAKIAMMAMTTSSSTSVNPPPRRRVYFDFNVSIVMQFAETRSVSDSLSFLGTIRIHWSRSVVMPFIILIFRPLPSLTNVWFWTLTPVIGGIS